MALDVGTWVRLHDGRTARIIELDEAAGTVLASTPDGHPVDRPISFAKLRWSVLDREGLRVRMATDAAGTRAAAVSDPVELVIAALVDAGGAASATDFRTALTPDPIAEADWPAWWGRVQPRLKSEPRIDPSQSRHGIYRLGMNAGRSYPKASELLKNESREGRRLLDARALVEIRALVAHDEPLGPGERALVMEFQALAGRPDVDPTDRFLAADLGVAAGLTTSADARAIVGDDILRVDLCRVGRSDSRTRAFEWASALDDARDSQRRLGKAAAPLLLSAASLGKPWIDDGHVLAEALGVSRDAVDAGILGWSVPGAPESGPPKLPADLEAYRGRIQRAKAWLATTAVTEEDPAAGELEVKTPGTGLADGALRALGYLAPSPTHHPLWRNLMDDLASLVWTSRIDMARITGQDRVSALPVGGLEALIRMAPGSGMAALRSLVVRRFAEEPGELRGTLTAYSEKAHTDELALILDAARMLIAKARVRPIAASAIDLVRKSSRTDALAFESASLAGTIAADHPGVADVLEFLSNRMAELVLAGEDPEPVPVWFSAVGFQRFAGRVNSRVESAERRMDAAIASEQTLAERLEQREEALRLRTEALGATRTEAGTDDRSATRRTAIATLRPIAQALADSFESASLAGLQDAVQTVLGRAKVRPIGEPGQVVDFDPTRHRWVGSGVSTDRAMVISPGFAAEGEEDANEIVLVPARVVDPTSG